MTSPSLCSCHPSPHLFSDLTYVSTSCPVVSHAIYSLAVSSKLATGFSEKARLCFFLAFPFLSSTSKSTLLLTSGLLLCLTASLPHVKMSASAWQGEDAYSWVIGRKHVTALLCGDGVRDGEASCDYTIWDHREGRADRVQLCDSAMGTCLCQNILV